MTRKYVPRGSSLGTRIRLRSTPGPGGCWIWDGAKTRDGYGKFAINGSWLLAHRVSIHAFKGVALDVPVVMHTCDVPSCVNPDHLRAATQKLNIEDAAQKGRMRKLPEHRVAASIARIRITPSVCEQAIVLISGGLSQAAAARTLGVSPGGLCVRLKAHLLEDIQ